MLQLPEEIKIAIAAGLGFLVTQGFKTLGEKIGVDLSGNAAQVTALLCTLIVYLLQTALDLVPAEYRGIVGAVLGVLVAVMGAYGLHYSYSKIRK